MQFLHCARCLLFANTHTHTRHTAQPHIISLLIIIGTHDMDGNGLDGGAVVILLRITNEYVNVSGICMVLLHSPCIYGVYSLLLNFSWPFCFCFFFSWNNSFGKIFRGEIVDALRMPIRQIVEHHLLL